MQRASSIPTSCPPRGELMLRFGVLILCVISITLGGCSHARNELVEADLRAKEEQIEQLRGELGSRDASIRAMEMELAQMQRQCQQQACLNPGLPLVVRGLALGRLTGGYDEDVSQYGDEALQVLIEPRDAEDQSVKAPGCLQLAVYEILPNGVKVPLSTWEISATELRRKWDTPIFGSPAYRVVVPWKQWPTSEKLRVVARFTTLAGECFEADKDVAIRLPESQRGRKPARGPGGEGPVLTPHVCPPEEDELPQPRPVAPSPMEPPAMPPPGPAAAGKDLRAPTAMPDIWPQRPPLPAEEARPPVSVPAPPSAPARPAITATTYTATPAPPPPAARVPSPQIRTAPGLMPPQGARRSPTIVE